MRIGIAQTQTRAGDLEANAQRMIELSQRAAERGVDLLVFPVAVLSGVAPAPLVDREGYFSDLVDVLIRLIDELACPCLVPMIFGSDDTLSPEAVLIDKDDVRPIRLATRLEAMAAAGDQSPMEDPLPELPYKGARLGVAFSYEDLDDYDNYDYDVDVIVFLPSYGYAIDDPSSALGSSLTEGRFLADAEATGAWIVGAGSLGCYDAQVFCGASFVLAPWGELAAQSPAFEEDLLVCDVDPSAEGPLAEPVTPEVFDTALFTWECLGMGLASLVQEAGASGACVAVTDSLADALTAVIAVDAFGPLGVSAVVARTGNANRDARTRDLVRGLRLDEASVEELDVSGAADEQEAFDLLQLRLAALARRTGRVPLGSADKTARALEGASAQVSAGRVEPFGDVYRSDLITLAWTRNTISPLLSRGTLERYGVPALPGAESLPASREEQLRLIDLILTSYLEWGRGVTDIVDERGHEDVVLAVVDTLRSLEASRGSAAIAPVVSSRLLDEARAPVGFVWRDRVRAPEERLDTRLEELVSEGERHAAPSEGPADTGDDAPRTLKPMAPHDGEFRDLMGYLRDFSAGGPFSALGGEGRPAPGNPPDFPAPPTPGLWNGPFSEN